MFKDSSFRFHAAKVLWKEESGKDAIM